MNEASLGGPETDARAARRFLEHFALERESASEAYLAKLARAFSRLPYENLTKIVKLAAEGSPERSRRWPLEVIADHAALGTGGTCFSLTQAFVSILRSLGFEAEPILADRPYGSDTHSALIVRLAGHRLLLDPGFLLPRPIPLVGSGPIRIEANFREILLEGAGDSRIALKTREDGRENLRLVYRSDPASPAAFLRAWDASFAWDMMRYPLLTRSTERAHLYLRRGHFRIRDGSGLSRTELGADALPHAAEARFGIARSVAERALEVLASRGERV